MSTNRRTFLTLISAIPFLSQALTQNSYASMSSKPIKIGIIGAGWLGGSVGQNWVKSGHEVMFSSRNPKELEKLTQSLGPKASIGYPKDAAAFGTVLLFATPYDALPQLGHDLDREISGKIILDACNPSPSPSNALAQQAAKIGVGRLSQQLLPHSRVVRAFSAVDASAIERSYTQTTNKLGVPIASDDKEALQIAAQLVQDAGCDPVIVGNMEAAQLFQRGGPGFRANTTAVQLQQLLKVNNHD